MDKYNQRKKGILEKKSLRLFQGDAAFIDECYPRAGHNIIIRSIVHNFVKKLREKTSQQEIENEFGNGIGDGISLGRSGEGEPE